MAEVTMQRDDIIARLDEQMPVYRERDRQVMKKHKADEADALKAFRTDLREALRWDYQTAKARRFELRYREYPASCPVSMVAQAERAIARLKLSRQKTYRLSNVRGSVHADLFHLVTFDPDETPLQMEC